MFLRDLFHFSQLSLLKDFEIEKETFINLVSKLNSLSKTTFRNEFQSILFSICDHLKLKSKISNFKNFEFLNFVKESNFSNDFLQIIKDCIYKLPSKERTVLFPNY
jgi:uncharacterized Zn finger protein